MFQVGNWETALTLLALVIVFSIDNSDKRSSKDLRGRQVSSGPRRRFRSLRIGRGERGHRSDRGEAIRFGVRMDLSIRRGSSLLVFGPTRSGKTRSVVVPAVRSWRGSILVTSVKEDVLDQTIKIRRSFSDIVILGTREGSYRRFWDPTLQCDSPVAAKEMAARMIHNTPAFRTSSGDARFWYHLGEPVLAGACRLAYYLGGSRVLGEMVGAYTLANLAARLEDFGEPTLAAAVAALNHDDPRHNSSIVLTLTQVVQPYVDAAEAFDDAMPLDLRELWVPGGDEWRPFSLYLCAPFHLQKRISPYLSTLVSTFAEQAMRDVVACERGHSTLVVLDEAANIAPVVELAELASVGTDLGLQLISVFQDVNQVERVYAQHAGTLINNHRAKLFLSSVSDPATMHLLDDILGRGSDRMQLTVDRTEAEGRVDWRRVPYGFGWLVEGSARARYVRVDRSSRWTIPLQSWIRSKFVRANGKGSRVRYGRTE